MATFRPGDIISYLDICQEEKINLQRGMNFKLRNALSVFLMSIRRGAPYADRVEDEGRILIYEGHDISKTSGGPDPKKVDQPTTIPSGRRTQNGLFYDAAIKFKLGQAKAELVKVYEKIKDGIWVYNGIFKLLDAWLEQSGCRKVFKFRLELMDQEVALPMVAEGERLELDTSRVIPSSVKQAVWKRDKGQCTKCGAKDNLHFDHILPWSKGGTSLLAVNVQLLCARHNLNKKDHIE
jgi:hypothetical protein